ncbi:MAG: hypothetical protein ACM3JH_12975 [Acidithiobacillales bacterium]
MALPDGKLSAGDPSQDLFRSDFPPVLTAGFEPGAYAVDVTFAEKRSDRRIAAVIISFSAAEPTFWEKACLSDDDQHPSGSHEIAVDSARAYLGAFAAARSIALSGTPLVDIAARGQRGQTFEWGEVPVAGAGNLFFFSTGMGDGTYPLFLGRDVAGHPAVLILDFLLIGKP